MACPFIPTGGRICPRTGRICPHFPCAGQIRCSTGGGGVPAAAIREGVSPCTPLPSTDIPSTSAQLYGAPVMSAPVYATCSDPYSGTQQYPLDWRNRFWPTFAHPRWLPCAELYNVNR